MPEFGRLSEVIVFVNEMEPMVTFYEDVLGLTRIEGGPDDMFVRFETETCDLCLHGGRSDAVGEYEPKIVFQVPDFDAARSHLEAADVTLGDIREPAPGIQVFDGLDPEGNTFSIEAQTPTG